VAETLYLSKDRKQIVDAKDNVLFVAEDRDGKTVYVEAAPKAQDRVCIRTKLNRSKICVEYNHQRVCVNWAFVDVEVCVEWSKT
jgi:hypothetical protein